MRDQEPTLDQLFEACRVIDRELVEDRERSRRTLAANFETAGMLSNASDAADQSVSERSELDISTPPKTAIVTLATGKSAAG